jgi:hypothetical protein
MDVRGQLHAPAALLPGKKTGSRYPMYRRIVGPPRQGTDDLEKIKISFSYPDSNPGHFSQ